MKIDWNIDYEHGIASCSQMKVVLKQVEKPVVQDFNGVEIGFGFTKYESGKMYQGYIIDMSQELFNEILKNQQLLSQYGSSLGDAFNEFEFEDHLREMIRVAMGKKPTYKMLAEYLNVSESAVKQYPKTKRELMIYGLWLKNFMQS